MELNDIERETILAYAKCDMNANATGKMIFASHNTVEYWLAKIFLKTGLNPKKFYDLIKLVDMCR